MILGRPFLNTGRALIDVFTGKLMLRIDEEHVTFDVLKFVKHSVDYASFSRIDIIYTILHESAECMLLNYPVESCLMMTDEINLTSVEVNEGKRWKDANMMYMTLRTCFYETIERTSLTRFLI